jgi:hypothetical protein
MVQLKYVSHSLLGVAEEIHTENNVRKIDVSDDI